MVRVLNRSGFATRTSCASCVGAHVKVNADRVWKYVAVTIFPLERRFLLAGEQYGEADVETVPQPLLDAEGRYHEAKDAYKEAVKAVRQARQQMGCEFSLQHF